MALFFVATLCLTPLVLMVWDLFSHRTRPEAPAASPSEARAL